MEGCRYVSTHGLMGRAQNTQYLSLITPKNSVATAVIVQHGNTENFAANSVLMSPKCGLHELRELSRPASNGDGREYSRNILFVCGGWCY